ncbi:MAG: hypothetical protein HW408_936 [Actinobacteria bacterium]|nr:hypothetical protein [Actinomycetota bacterium]
MERRDRLRRSGIRSERAKPPMNTLRCTTTELTSEVVQVANVAPGKSPASPES